jgi:uncharacterized pyridoxamine 5'-phosphate oxidase family protein
MTMAFIYIFIKQNKFAVLSTVSSDNTPESACVDIAVTEEVKLIFDTVSDSRKYKNLLLNKNISFVIGWENRQTIQYEEAEKNFNKTHLNEFLNIYLEAFPDGTDRKENWKNITYFVVEPKWLRFSDFSELPPAIE